MAAYIFEKRMLRTFIYNTAVAIIDKVFDLYLYIERTVEKSPFLLYYWRHGKEIVKTCFVGLRSEPDMTWFCLATLQEKGAGREETAGNKYELVEEYFYYYNENVEEVYENKKKDKVLFILNTAEDEYIVRQTINGSEVKDEREKVDSPFFSIQYLHPKLNENSFFKKKVFIDIPKQYFYEGNELLSAIFVKRWFEYYLGKIPFDENYVLRILDTDLTEIELDFHQSIRILENGGYEILSTKELLPSQ